MKARFARTYNVRSAHARVIDGQATKLTSYYAVTEHLWVFSFPGHFSVREPDKFQEYSTLFRNRMVTIKSPVRLMPLNWRGIPGLSESNIHKVLENLKWPGLSAQGLTVDCSVGGAICLTMQANASIPMSNSYPDALCIVVQGESDEKLSKEIAKDFTDRLLLWIRILTRQYWAGRGFPASLQEIGHLPILSDGSCGYTGAFKSAPFYIWDAEAFPVTEELWVDCIRKINHGATPSAPDLMLADLAYMVASGLESSAIIQATSLIEAMRNAVLDKSNQTVRQLRCGQTDLLKHLTKGFLLAFGRDLSTEFPESYEYLKKLWAVRGLLAHGCPVQAAGQLSEPVIGEHGKMRDHVTTILRWMNGIEPVMSYAL